jgi:hypothetical protein
MPMRSLLWVAGPVAALALVLAGGSPALAHYCKDGQEPVPPEVAAQMALPLCGFAATKRWGPNGCQLCDSRNMYPNPFSHEDRAPRRPHAYQSYQ